MPRRSVKSAAAPGRAAAGRAAEAVPERAAAPGGVTSVDRALSLLGAFSADRPTLSLTELSALTQQYKSTVLRMMASLEFAQFTRRDADGRFTPGPGVARLNAAYAASFSIGDAVRPVLAQLVEATHESAAYHVRQGEQDLCLYRVDSPLPVRDHLRAGELQPLARSVSGIVMRAYGQRGGGRAARIRREHLLVADGDIVPELGAIAPPVFGPDGGVAGVLALTMPAMRLDRRHVEPVRRAARRLSTELGGSYPAPADIRGNPR